MWRNSMKVVSIVGTRPEMIKMSEVIKKLDEHTNHVLIHTNQNYDYELNDIFRDIVRRPDRLFAKNEHFLGHLMTKTKIMLEQEKPDSVVILGDTNSALSGIIAKRMKIPVFHLEAGNRCFDDNVPEEINRRMIDHISDVNLVYTEHARRNLLAEGIKSDRIFLTGSPMNEVISTHLESIKNSEILNELMTHVGVYYLVSIHREENVENSKHLKILVNTINKLAKDNRVILTCHPRLASKDIKFHKNVTVHKPFGFFDYIRLQAGAKCVLSDSGTISEESAILGFPAVTLRTTIERPEAVDSGSIVVTGVDQKNILESLRIAHKSSMPVEYQTKDFSDRVLKVILGYTQYVNRYVYGK
jgi:UDP-N-acetylglucosamine 2-epimerase